MNFQETHFMSLKNKIFKEVKRCRKNTRSPNLQDDYEKSLTMAMKKIALY